MSNNDQYEVSRHTLTDLDFEVLILKVPENEIEDKLAYLAREKGNISKLYYEDFVISNCVANINQLLFHIRNQTLEAEVLAKIRSELSDLVFEVNELLRPENLVINRNYVIKLKGKKGPKKDEKLLTETNNWNTDPFSSQSPLNDSEDFSDRYKKGGKKKIDDDNKGKIKDIDELSYGISKQWWRRLNQYLEIKKFNPEDVESILKHRFFHNRSSFNTFMVSICVVEFEDLFARLDKIGIPKRVSPPILMNELYELCKKVNPFLTFENAQDLAEEQLDDDEDDGSCQAPQARRPPGAPNRMASTMSGHYKKSKKKKKKFKDVPREDLLSLSGKMKVFVIGQDEAVDSIAEAVKRASVGLKDPVKPIGSFLFAGRTGVGKTLTTKVLADELIKDKDNIITIDCSEYSSDHEYAKLIGAPAGYVGHEQGGVLTNAITKAPFSVVVFDEIEKASAKVHELLLQILEEGRLTDGKGVKVSFKDAIVIMTSNIGVSEVDEIKRTIGFGDVATITEDKKDKAINRALKNKFKPEFLNRIDAVINFKSLTKNDYMRIIDIELYKLNENLRNNDTEFKGVELRFDKKVHNHVYKNGIDPDFGARPLKRCIERDISTPLANRLLEEEDVEKDSVINVSFFRNKIKLDIEKRVDAPPFYVSKEYQENSAV